MAILQNTLWQLNNDCNPTLTATLQFGASEDFVYNLVDLVGEEQVRWEGVWALSESEVRLPEDNGQRISLTVDRLFVKPPGEDAFDLRYPVVLSEVKMTGDNHLGDIEKREMWLKLRPLDEVAESKTKTVSVEGESRGAVALPVDEADTLQKTMDLRPGTTLMCSCERARGQFWCTKCRALHCDHCACVSSEVDNNENDGYVDPFAIIIDPYTCREADQDPAKYTIRIEEFQKRWKLLRTSTFLKRF